MRDIWVIGDHFVRDSYPYLQAMEDEHLQGYTNYLHQNYDVYAFYPKFTDKNILSMIRESFVEGLNKRSKLPNCVIVLYSETFLTEDPLYLPSEMERKLKWLMRELNSLVQIRKSQLPTKAYNFGEPRFMWARAFQNTLSRNIDPLNLLKFNNLLRRLCISRAIYSLPVEERSSDPCFDFNGKAHLKSGFIAFWTDIIKAIQEHDKNDKKYRMDRTVGDTIEVNHGRDITSEPKQNYSEPRNDSGRTTNQRPGRDDQRRPRNRRRSDRRSPRRTDFRHNRYQSSPHKSRSKHSR